MDKNDILFKENVKKSFIKAKQEISDIKNDINETKNLIQKNQQELETIKKLILENKPVSEPNSKNEFKSSIGNRGVPMRYLCVTYASKNGKKEIVNIDELKKDIEQRFSSLTSKEFEVFMALYQLEEELKRPITYLELSQRLKMSIGSVRDYMKTLTFKAIPIQKAFIDGRKVSFFVQKELRDLNIASKLLSLRDPYSNQTTLF